MSDLLKALRRLRALDSGQRLLLLQAALLLPAVHTAQKTLPFKWWRARGTRPRTSGGAPPQRLCVQDIAASVEVARKWVPGSYACLPSAYTAHLLLQHYGFPSDLHVGVRKNAAGRVDAHAWVTCEGQIVVGALDDLASFTELPPLAPEPR